MIKIQWFPWRIHHELPWFNTLQLKLSEKIGETLNHQRFLYLAIFGLDFIHGNGWCLWWTPLKFPWNQLSPSSSKAPFAARGTRPHGPRGGCPTNRRHRRAGQAGAPGKSLVEWEISGKDVCFLTSFFFKSFWCFFDVFFLSLWCLFEYFFLSHFLLRFVDDLKFLEPRNVFWEFDADELRFEIFLNGFVIGWSHQSTWEQNRRNT